MRFCRVAKGKSQFRLIILSTKFCTASAGTKHLFKKIRIFSIAKSGKCFFMWVSLAGTCSAFCRSFFKLFSIFPILSVLIVFFPFFGIAEYFIGLVDLLEFFVCVFIVG